MVEPIQGEAGVMVPQEGYLRKAHELCKKHNVLLVADEVQTGFGRTGKLFCSDYDNIKPDAVVVGKALSGGLYPVSGVLADEAVMGVFEARDARVDVRGVPAGGGGGDRGGGGAVRGGDDRELVQAGGEVAGGDEELDEGEGGQDQGRARAGAAERHRGGQVLAGGKFAYKWCIKMAEKGLLAKPTHGNIIRFSPPLVITEEELADCTRIIKEGYEAAVAEL
eukprot:Sspe_Gene.649::Locus_219_Transcript_1_1_Confidence_1.000_Length_1587::g.649::m.649/K00819/rocD, OAT; ornithine--oxo-acid transaminase